VNSFWMLRRRCRGGTQHSESSEGRQQLDPGQSVGASPGLQSGEAGFQTRVNARHTTSGIEALVSMPWASPTLVALPEQNRQRYRPISSQEVT
jgi:hypothetical protein